LEKQIILETFLRQSGIDFNQLPYFWINAVRDSSGEWKWLKSGKKFTFTKWYADYPWKGYMVNQNTLYDNNYVVVLTYSTEKFGKWFNDRKADTTTNVICEHTFEF